MNSNSLQKVASLAVAPTLRTARSRSAVCMLSRAYSDKPAISTEESAPSVAAADDVALEERPIYRADAVSGVPPEISRRGVRVYRPARTATQQGSNKDMWRIDFDVQQRWENKLMGWSSSGDPVQAAKIEFKTRDDAIMFAERQGYDYWVDEPKEPKFRKKVYADNFVYSADKLKMIRTK